MSDKVHSITGTIKLTDGTESQFIIGLVSGDPYWSQWSGDAVQLGRTVNVLDALTDTAADYLGDDEEDDESTCPNCGKPKAFDVHVCPDCQEGRYGWNG